MLATGGGGQVPLQRLTPLPNRLWARAFTDGGRGLQAQSTLTGILKWVSGGLTSVVLVVLRTARL